MIHHPANDTSRISTVISVGSLEEPDISPMLMVGLAGTLAVAAVLLAADVIADVSAGAASWHLLVEVGAVAAVVATVTIMARVAWRARAQAVRDRRELVGARVEAQRWRHEAREALAGLGTAIEAQFERWQFTPAEREVALLLLKGLGLKEIADVRNTTERTTRQQALGVYRKAGLSGRAELAAFFLEDLLLPRDARGDVHPKSAVDT